MKTVSTQLNLNNNNNNNNAIPIRPLFYHTQYLENRRHSLAPDTVKLQTSQNVIIDKRAVNSLITAQKTNQYTNVVPKNNSIIKYNSNNNLRVPTEYNIINNNNNNNRRFSTSSALHATINNNTVTNSNVAAAHNSQIIAIDSKIEQAMDLVKTHLMFAVREEVENLRTKIIELETAVVQLEAENSILREHVSSEILQNLTLQQNNNVNPSSNPTQQSMTV